MKYSEETKQKARELCAQGLSQREVGRRLGVSQTTMRRWVSPGADERARVCKQRWLQNNLERSRETNRQWHAKNRERSLQMNKMWAKKNPKRKRTYRRRWEQAHPERVRERNAFRRAAKKQATPPWLTPEHRKQMKALHAEARRLKKVTGVQHHVDHIIPLHAKFDGKGKQIACGLHVPWNLKVLPGPENNVKYCKLPGPEHWTAPAQGGIIEGSSGDTHGFA